MKRWFGVFAPLAKEAAKDAPRSRLQRWEKRIGQYGEQLLREPSNKQLVGEIRQLLDSRMKQHSSEPELQQHFSELFSGLDTLTQPGTDPVAGARPTSALAAEALRPGRTEAEIMRAFDAVYFHGRADYEFTTRIFNDSRVTDIGHFVRAVTGGGTILRWTQLERCQFRLAVANKLWRSGKRDSPQREEARRIVADALETDWIPRLAADTLTPRLMRQVVRAGAVVAPAKLDWALAAGNLGVRTAYAVWVVAIQAGNTHLADTAAEATGFASSLHAVAPAGGLVPRSLDVILHKADPEANLAQLLSRHAALTDNYELAGQVQRDAPHLSLV